MMNLDGNNDDLWIRGTYPNGENKINYGENDVFIVTAGQSVADVFPDWVKQTQLCKSQFIPNDSNYCSKLPRREFLNAAYEVDPPLTQFGEYLSRVIGRQLKASKINPSKVFAGPSLKCLETAAYLGYFFKEFPATSVEPGLWSEFKSIDSGFLLSPKETEKNGIPLQKDYDQKIISENADTSNWQQWQLRTAKIFTDLLTEHKGHLVFILDRLTAKTILTHVIYGHTNFKNEESFLSLAAVPSGACVAINREGILHPLKLSLSENPFPGCSSTLGRLAVDYDRLDDEVYTVID